MWKEAAMAYFGVSDYLPVGIEDDHKNSTSVAWILFIYV
jgi:hypothetical protein